MLIATAKSALLVVATAICSVLAVHLPSGGDAGFAAAASGTFAGHAFPARPIERERLQSDVPPLKRVRCPSLARSSRCYVAA